ncbi:MAG: nucleotide sugar dehydrogenase [Chloroflexi bacterium]|jgi:UDP-N-acetyl-D-glucosamine dehydrogenase|nr:nucleotide sugar dehydrogenase [Chloroflexota bacterium]MBT3670224.1 nucleotide sugar dehydrogenase [Chloroflexota bacterium]MBT4003754.1 nucleotide sugar dehydrogenase [Chloroflexota bacterium]MBT4306102.1 nucleotide sugar dehydrogenase [Chloroflexota bacterium]MBT4534482.1 nucleotide sugar dehydrogenase [Chloroflexota bacterium]
MSEHKEKLLKKFKDKTAVIAVLGQGYVGLPLATVFGEAGFTVIGIDPDQQKVDSINEGKSYIEDVPTELVEKLVAEGKLSATTDFSKIKEVDAVSICVPTPLRKTGDPDLSFILTATEELKKHLYPGLAIVLESTTYPGTTRELVLDNLSQGSDLQVGEDFFLAFSPERVDPGREDWTTVNTPKVMGGITPNCSDVCAVWYEQALETVVKVTSTEVAEMTKLLENTFRMVNIGLVNELALMCNRLGVDVWEVIDAAATKPFGFMKFTPGPGLGGHCIPIDPLYLSWKLKSLNYTARFIELASEINTGMPRYVVNRLMEFLNDHAKSLNGSKILVLGVAYKPDIDDLRESPALDVISLLQEKKAEVSYHDPFIPQLRHETIELDSVPNLMDAISEADCVLIITDHTEYEYSDILKNANLVLDTRNAIGEKGRLNDKVELL